MLIRWIAFCHESAVSDIQERLLGVIGQMNPGITPQTWVSRRWNDPLIYRITYEFSAPGLPEHLEELAAGIAGHGNTYVIDQEQYLETGAQISRAEIKNSPEKANVVCAVYKNLD